MEHYEQLEQVISEFLNRFKPTSKKDYEVLRAIQRDLTGGMPLMSQIDHFASIADTTLLEALYDLVPDHRAVITQNEKCPAELLAAYNSIGSQIQDDHPASPAPDQGTSVSKTVTDTVIPFKDHPLLVLDRNISLDLKGLSDYAASLPAGELSGSDKAGCVKRIENLQRQFDQVPAVLQETDLTDNEHPLFYDLLTAKQHIYKNQRLFSRLRIGLMNRFAKDTQDKEEDSERSLLDQNPENIVENDIEETEPPVEEEPTEEDLDAEEARQQAEAEAQAASEAEAKEAKKAANEKRQKRLQRENKEQEDRSYREQRAREDRLRQETMITGASPVISDSSAMVSSSPVAPPYPTDQVPSQPVTTAPYDSLDTQGPSHSDVSVPEPVHTQDSQGTAQPAHRDTYYQELQAEQQRVHQEQRSAEKQAVWEQYLNRQEQSANYESFGKGHIDFSGKDQHGNIEPYPSASDTAPSVSAPSYDGSNRYVPGENSHASATQSTPEQPVKPETPRPEAIIYDNSAVSRDTKYPSPAELSYHSIPAFSSGPVNTEASSAKPIEGPIDSKPFENDHREEVQRKQDRYDEADYIAASQREQINRQAKREESIQTYQDRMDRSQSYESFGKGHVDFSGKGQHGSMESSGTAYYQPSWLPPVNGQKPFQPHVYTATGMTPIVGVSQTEAHKSNHEIYQEAISSGTITPVMARTMRSNLEAAHQEYKQAVGTSFVEEAAKRYKADRDAVSSLNKALKEKTITFAREDIKPDSIANVNPVYRKTSDQGFTAFTATPRGANGISFDQNGPVGHVFIHNTPGQIGKEVLSKEKPMVVTKAYEDQLATHAQRAKEYMQQRLSSQGGTGYSKPLTAAEMAGYRLCVDAYDGFRRAKSEGLVKISSGTGVATGGTVATEKPDFMAWAARETTYRKTLDPQNAKYNRSPFINHNLNNGTNDSRSWSNSNANNRNRSNVDLSPRNRGGMPDERMDPNKKPRDRKDPGSNGRRSEKHDWWDWQADNWRPDQNWKDRRPNDRRSPDFNWKDRKYDKNKGGPDPRSLDPEQKRFWETFNWRGENKGRNFTDPFYIAPFGSVFSIRYNRGRYTTGEKETSARVLNHGSKLRHATVIGSVGSSIYGRFSAYAPQAGNTLLRKVYSMVQSSGEAASQSIRTFEQGRYYGGVAVGVASAVLHQNVGNVKQFQKAAVRAERHAFGFKRELSTQQIGKHAHSKMNEGRALKKEIQGMYEREAGLSAAERKILAQKIKDHQRVGKETAQWVSLQKARQKEKIQKEILEQLHQNPNGRGLLTENALNKLKAERKALQSQRRAILESQPERAALNKRIAELQAKEKKTLTKAEIQELRDKRKQLSKLTTSDPRLKALDQKEQALLKAIKNKPDETAVGLKHIRLKDANKLRADIIKQHNKLESEHFKEFLGVKNKSIKANKKRLEQQSKFAKRRSKELLKKGLRTPAEEKELQTLLAKLKTNQAKIKRHADILKLRETRDTKIEIIDKIRKRLMKNKQQKRFGRMALVSYMMKPLQEGDGIGAQGLAKGISFGTNPYIHRLVSASLRTTWNFNKFAIKKIGKWTGLDVKMEPVISSVKTAAEQVRKVANTPREFKKKTIKTVSKAAKEVRDRMTPKFIKTGVQRVKAGWASATNYLKQSKLGKAYEATARFFSRVKHILGTVGKVIGSIAAKAIIIFLAIFLIVGLLTVIGGAVGGSVPTFTIMSPDVDEETEKLDLSAYVDVYKKKMIEYSQEITEARNAKDYENITEIREGPQDGNNMKEILSMMAVRMYQDLDMDENPKVEKYIKSLFDDSHTIVTEESEPYSCSGCETKLEPADHNANCPVDCTVEHTEEVVYCPGTHVDLNITITTLTFDEIFYADSMGNKDAEYIPGEAIGTFDITHYCACKVCCGPNAAGITASGKKPKANHTIAVDPDVIPMGSTVIINGQKYVAEDTGGAIKGNRIDIYMADHDEALSAGRFTAKVYWPTIEGESYQETGEWDGWTDENIAWAKIIYEADWNELYTGFTGVTIGLGNTTDLSGVDFVDGDREGNEAIVNIALSQLGQSGGQPYWSWYGFDYRVEWCAVFVSWCADQTGTSAVPSFAHCANQGVPWFQKNKQWASRGDVTPVAGDIIFFDWQGDGVPDHVGIVVGSDGSKVYTVEGNSGDMVKTLDYSLSSSVIFGYGLPNY